MTTPKLPLENGADQPGRGGDKPKFTIELLSYDQTRVSIYNPHCGVTITDDSVQPLLASVKATGQVNDAIGWRGTNGVVELDAGGRRREVTRLLGKPLRVRVS